MKRISSFIAAAAFAAAFAFSAAGPPLAGVWNIAPTGSAGSSGDLVFRVNRGDGSDPVEISVPVRLGADQATVARGIRSALSSQLGRGHYQVELGEGGNVLVSDPRGQPNFSVELLDSDVDGLRVAVQSVTPSAAPTVPTQSVPAVPPPVTSPMSGVPANPVPDANAPLPNPNAPAPNPNAPVPSPSTPVPNPNAPVPSPPTPMPNPAPVPAPAVPVPGGTVAPASAPPPR